LKENNNESYMKKEYAGKIKLYADENIRLGIVLALRLQGINIKHSSEVNLINRDDQDHFQYAKKTKRWLLTTDKDFLNHNIFPFEQIKGIIIVPDTGNDLIAGKIMAWIKLELVPSGKGINNCKIELKENSAIFHFRMEGKIYTQKTDFT
jgi:predicted nuclease of predicted toxin-antitoxin system